MAKSNSTTGAFASAENHKTGKQWALCPHCDQPMLPKGMVKQVNEFDHAAGCPLQEQNCFDCPPVGYPTDKTRCSVCPRRASSIDHASFDSVSVEVAG